MCISINEKAESVFIPRYLKAKNNFQTFETGILSELNQIEIYCNNNYSFYMNDEFAPGEVTTYFAPGDSLDYIIRAIQKRIDDLSKMLMVLGLLKLFLTMKKGKYT